MLLAGFDDGNGPELYFMDWLASLQKVSMLHVVVTFNSICVQERDKVRSAFAKSVFCRSLIPVKSSEVKT